MLVITLNAQNSTLMVVDNEVNTSDEDTPCENTYIQTSDIGEDEGQGRKIFSSFELEEVDFEGLVLNLIDKNGQKWSTEIIGQVAVGTV